MKGWCRRHRHMSTLAHPPHVGNITAGISVAKGPVTLVSSGAPVLSLHEPTPGLKSRQAMDSRSLRALVGTGTFPGVGRRVQHLTLKTRSTC